MMEKSAPISKLLRFKFKFKCKSKILFFLNYSDLISTWNPTHFVLAFGIHKRSVVTVRGCFKEKNYSHTRVIIHNGKWRRPLRERPSNIPSGNWTKLIRHTQIHLEYQTLNPLFWIHVCHCQLNNWIYNRLRNIYSKSSFLLSELIRSS